MDDKAAGPTLASTAPCNMSCGHPNQACARSSILARLGPSTPQNDRMNGRINLLLLIVLNLLWIKYFYGTHVRSANYILLILQIWPRRAVNRTV